MPNKLITRKCLAVSMVLFIGLVVSADPLVNSWTNPMSAPWEGSTNWSLGQLPASNQSVMITNAGYKGVGISPSTPTNFPMSMTVSNLTISAPANAFSTLLLNYCGTATPLEVLDDCTIGSNGSIVNLYAAFEVQSRLLIDGGQYVEEGGLTIATNGGAAVYGGALNLTNAVFAGSIELGGGTVTQVGGQTSSELVMYSGTYNLLGGTFTGECFYNNEGSFFGPQFNQYGGTNTGNIMIGGGRYDGSGQYTIYSGLAAESDIYVGNGEYGHGNFSQFGGTVITTSLELGSYGDGVGTATGGYYLTNGTLQVGKIKFQSGGLNQSGGQLITTNEIFLEGVPAFDYGPALYVSCGMSGGELSCPGISVSLNGSFGQSGGTNTVSGDLSMDGGGYVLSGGLLLTSNLDTSLLEVYVPGSGLTVYGGSFQQSGGNLYVTSTLWNSNYCSISGGSVNASNIMDAGTLSVSSNAMVLNPGMFEFAGKLQVSYGAVANFGEMLLSSNSVIEFTTGADRVSFLNSAAMNWNQTCSLTMVNWNGSTNGGGSDQLMFGNNSSGLTPAQLRQIVFVNPAGFPAGAYPAQMFATGEVVPAQRPMLLSSRNQNGLILNWSSGFVLQSATNVQGPYSDITGASSPYTNLSFQLPQQFFRLRH